ncbi:hypothetical protein N5079_12765 [Planotetraspora sp. A-T 1434]|uniref:hypothetical protein n=1 Tax=Planotetraspora sp. A-T 1434 TaxID=2979219 RepID=UPI0021BE86F6|nr:hypothetical protein [Planotetraspora sp. A-T 1434]MCT9931088.1 hypothetical protein [Planotetraspora sp. A-T 1434]
MRIWRPPFHVRDAVSGFTEGEARQPVDDLAAEHAGAAGAEARSAAEPSIR